MIKETTLLVFIHTCPCFELSFIYLGLLLKFLLQQNSKAK